MIGVAVSARRQDIITQAIEGSKQVEHLLGYTFNLAIETIRNKEWRAKVLRNILLIYQRL